MKYSLNWIRQHIDTPLPQTKDIVREITLRAFEVEEVVEKDGDTILDIKVLPDRAHDALCHRGMAREVTSLFGLKRKELIIDTLTSNTEVPSVRVTIDAPTLCTRYIGVRVDGVAPTPSPTWLADRLTSIGQRSINALVDITNFVMLDIGQPMHAFDAAKVKGGITVRLARAGETMTTLDNKSLTLDGTELVIADDEGVLALAGVKGGKKAEVDSTTTSVILESANFDPTLTRKTSTKHGIKTDASKRYENGISDRVAEEGAQYALHLLSKIFPDMKTGSLSDVFPAKNDWQYVVGVSLHEINSKLGTTLVDEEVKNILTKAHLPHELVRPVDVLKKSADATLGKAYKNPSSMRFDAPEVFSCSSLVSYLYAKAGIAMPSISVDKLIFGTSITKDELRYGDLIFSNSGEGRIYTETVEYKKGTPFPEGVDHVGMYVGEGRVLHASKTNMVVAVEVLADAKQFQHIVGYRRMCADLEEPRFVVAIPYERLDLRRSHDLVEEIGRLYGYNNITPVLPKLGRVGAPHKRLYYANKVRKFLVECGYSEVVTYSFAVKGEGEIEVQNPVGMDRPFMRSSLVPGISRALQSNYFNAPLIGITDVKIFEFGNIFTPDGERMVLAYGVMGGTKKRWKVLSAEFDTIFVGILAHLGIKDPVSFTGTEKLPLQNVQSDIREKDFDALIKDLPLPTEYEPLLGEEKPIRYQTLSAYPFIVRDIAVFVPKDVSEEEIVRTIKKDAGDLVVRFSQFDKFHKEGEERISYGYRLVFQSFERTLTDDEVNAVMEKVTKACTEAGFEVR
jgi:phenylalanyl-tRNA synthetase beta subunit